MFGRRRHRGQDPAAVVDRLRDAIGRLEQQRRAAADAAGRAFVSQAEITRVCTDQLAALRDAFAVAEDCEVTATRAAKDARADADPAADGFDRTVEALQASQRVLGEAAEPVHALLAQSRQNTERAREVLTRSRAVLDEQLREQVRILREFERAEVARVADAARRNG